MKRKDFKRASLEFEILCEKYPHFKFIGNTTFNVYMISKKYRESSKGVPINGWLLNDNKKAPKSFMENGKDYILIGNNFNNTKKVLK